MGWYMLERDIREQVMHDIKEDCAQCMEHVWCNLVISSIQERLCMGNVWSIGWPHQSRKACAKHCNAEQGCAETAFRKLSWLGLCDWMWSRSYRKLWHALAMMMYELLSMVALMSCLLVASQSTWVSTNKEKLTLVSWSWKWLKHVSCLAHQPKVNVYQDNQELNFHNDWNLGWQCVCMWLANCISDWNLGWQCDLLVIFGLTMIETRFLWHDCLLTMMTFNQHTYNQYINIDILILVMFGKLLLLETQTTLCNGHGGLLVLLCIWCIIYQYLPVIANRAMETLLNKSSGNNINLVAILAWCDIYLWLQTGPWRQYWAILCQRHR